MKITVDNRELNVKEGSILLDEARTAIRLGSESVVIYYRREEKDMQAQKEEIIAAKEEGILIEEIVGPTKVITKEGRVAGLKLKRMELGVSSIVEGGRNQNQLLVLSLLLITIQ